MLDYYDDDSVKPKEKKEKIVYSIHDKIMIGILSPLILGLLLFISYRIGYLVSDHRYVLDVEPSSFMETTYYMIFGLWLILIFVLLSFVMYKINIELYGEYRKHYDRKK
jgi:uncharacterized BrkB/YihY/UPF0761 family membrane protein